MLPNLYKDKKIQDELQFFLKKIEKISNTEIKKKALEYIKELKLEIKNLDEAHNLKALGDLKPNLFVNQRHKIITLRRNIEKIIKENKY